MRSQQARFTPERDEFRAQALFHAMRPLPRILLEWHDALENQATRALLQIRKLVGERKFHVALLPV
jgi:hypothetical protein